jgi:HEAT repeat protein
LAQLAREVKQPHAALPVLEHLLENDPLIATRMAAAAALGALGDPQARQTLERAAAQDAQTIVRDAATQAAGELPVAKR